MTDEINVLDHGKVALVDHMGTDHSIVEAARTSYGKGTRTTREDAGLIRYLMRHQHTTPFEMVDFKFYIKCPIFVARQWLRHRTASVNEYSGRYSEMSSDFYHPQVFKRQDTVNRQGSADELDDDTTQFAHGSVYRATDEAYRAYRALLQFGVSRETARIVLPVSNYTEFFWKMNLHNLFHFLQLRMDGHAQWETRQYANAIAELVKPIVPLAWQAFEEYVLKAATFSYHERKVLALMRQGIPVTQGDFDFFGDEPSDKTLLQRQSEFLAKLGTT
jgi:thymidylate synthase (FAD)